MPPDITVELDDQQLAVKVNDLDFDVLLSEIQTASANAVAAANNANNSAINAAASEDAAGVSATDAANSALQTDADLAATTVAYNNTVIAESNAVTAATQSGLYAAAAQALASGYFFTSLSDPTIPTLPNNTPFLIQGSSGGFVFAELYRRIGGVNVDQNLAISSAAQVTSLQATVSRFNLSGSIWFYTGTDTKKPLIVTPDLKMGLYYDGVLDQVTGPLAPSVSDDDSLGIWLYTGTSDQKPVIVDPGLRMQLYYDGDTGAMAGPLAVTGTVSGGAQTPFTPLASANYLPSANRVGVIVAGSSIGTGSYGQPPLSTTPSQWGHETFGYESGKGGVKATLAGTSEGWFNNTTMTTAQTLIEDSLSNQTDDPASSIQGETMLSGFCNGLSELALRENGVTAPTFFGSCPAIPGTSWAVKPSTRYSNIIDHITQQHALVTGRSQTYALGFVLVGVGAVEPGLTDAQFLVELQNFVDNITADTTTITGQTLAPHFLFTTAAYPSTYSTGGHPQAVLNLCLSRPNCWIGTPDYPFEMSPISPPHHTATGYKLIGVNMAVVGKQLLIDKVMPRAAYPISAVLQDSTVRVRMSMRVAPITLDETSVTVIDDGLRVSSDLGVSTLGPRSVASDGTLVIPLLSNVPNATQHPVLDTLSHTGLTNAQGSTIHDTDTRTIAFSNSSYPLWAWCTPFSIPITVLHEE